MPKVEAFRSRSLEEEYAVIWIDALYQKVRVEGRVVSVAVMIACGVNQSGNREILAVEPMFDESEDSWRLFFQNLKKRVSISMKKCTSYRHEKCTTSMVRSGGCGGQGFPSFLGI